MVDGRSLIPCDGELTVSKPLLDAVLPLGVHIGPASLVKDSADVKMLRAEKFDMSDTNNIFIGISEEAASELEHVVDGGARNTAILVNNASGVAVSADGVESYVAGVETTSLDLEIFFNEASAMPTTPKNIDSGQDYDAGSVHCLISNDGQVCKIFAQSNNDDINVWSSTTGPSGTFTEITPINPAAAVSRLMTFRMPRGSSTLLHMVMPTDKGLWISDDTGATWTEDVLLPTGDDPHHVAITSGGIVYAVESVSVAQMYKTTDKGANWTLAFDLGREMRDLDPAQTNIQIAHVEVDGSDNVYVIGFQIPHTVATSKQSIHMWFSEDAGVTWTHSVRHYNIQPDNTSANPIPINTKECLCDTTRAPYGALLVG